MMKSFILAATSIACVLSISNNVDANDMGINIISAPQNRSNLIAKKPAISSNEAVPESDLKSIRQELIAYYRKHNEEEKTRQKSGENFYEVKKVNILKFEMRTSSSGSVEKSAIIEVLQIDRAYTRYNIEGKGFIRKMNIKSPSRMIISMSFDSKIKKWEVFSTAFNESYQP
jgi:hypothetical protein